MLRAKQTPKKIKSSRTVDQENPDCPDTGFWQCWCRVGVLRRGAKVALVIGTLLIVINHWETVTSGSLPQLWKIALTYMVPFGVSTFSSARHAMEQSA